MEISSAGAENPVEVVSRVTGDEVIDISRPRRSFVGASRMDETR